MKTALYLRVSTSEQTTDNQQRELLDVAKARSWEIVKVYTDQAVSGAVQRDKRPGLRDLMADAYRKKFDLVAAWSVDRLGRSLSDLLRTSDDLRALDIQLYLHKQAVDTTTPTGRLTYQVLGAVAEWEREMIRARVTAGIARAKADGATLGRPVEFSPEVEAVAVAMHKAGKSLREIAEATGASKTTAARIVKKPVEEWLE